MWRDLRRCRSNSATALRGSLVCVEGEILVKTYTCGFGVCGQPEARPVLLWFALGSWLSVRPHRTRARHDKDGIQHISYLGNCGLSRRIVRCIGLELEYARFLARRPSWLAESSLSF